MKNCNEVITHCALRITHCLLIIFLLSFGTCAAQDNQDNQAELDAAEIRLTCAVCSLGAYSGDESFLLRSMLAARGWQIEKLSKKNNLADAKAYLAAKGDVKILAIAGTESLKDVEVDFRAGRVPLDDGIPLDEKEKHAGDKIFVHRGFRDYADVVLSDGLFERLTTSLKNNPNEKLYLTGHSLGGSVAIVMGLRLADAGVDKNQFAVITFGSMAVGSDALAKNYEDKVDVTRVVMKGDMLKKSMRALGYAEFGDVIKYESHSGNDHSEHKMAVYLDSALRDYYEAGGTLQHEAKEKVAAPVYIAPVLYDKSQLKKSDAKLILNALNDTLENHFAQPIFAEPRSIAGNAKDFVEPEVDGFIDAANESGCKYVLIRILSAKKIRDARYGERIVTLEEMIFDANGFLLSMQTSGASTENLTLLEAALSAQETLNASAKEIFTK